jgi:hypothetical protein
MLPSPEAFDQKTPRAYLARVLRGRNIALSVGIVLFALVPSFAGARTIPAFPVRVIQGGKQVKAQDGILPITRAMPFVLQAQAPAKTAILVNVTGRNEKTPVLTEANIHSIEALPSHALISDGTEYLWYRLAEKTTNKRSTQRNRWVSHTIEGFATISGPHWKLGTYILDDNLVFTIAAVPVNGKGKMLFSKNVVFSTVRMKLDDPSDEDDCHLIQNMYRGGGFEVPSCDELRARGEL